MVGKSKNMRNIKRTLRNPRTGIKARTQRLRGIPKQRVRRQGVIEYSGGNWILGTVDISGGALPTDNNIKPPPPPPLPVNNEDSVPEKPFVAEPTIVSLPGDNNEINNQDYDKELAELAAEVAAEPAVEPTVEPPVEPTVEPPVESVEPTIEPTVESVVESVEPTTEPTQPRRASITFTSSKDDESSINPIVLGNSGVKISVDRVQHPTDPMLMQNTVYIENIPNIIESSTVTQSVTFSDWVAGYMYNKNI